ncbi:hypothetical protein [Leifsonia poae]|uniref:hypothetical protein n=1 Tax=Leifsonia poae TaxID=110933 RepID=UPI003D678A07
MTAIRFTLHSTLSASEALGVLTDFGPTRADQWPSIDAEHFTVHDQGETWAEVTEGTEAAWERARYEWDEAAGRVVVTTHDSKVFGPGGGWEFQVIPEGESARIDVQLTRKPEEFGRKILAALLPLVGPSSLRKSFRQPLKTV